MCDGCKLLWNSDGDVQSPDEDRDAAGEGRAGLAETKGGGDGVRLGDIGAAATGICVVVVVSRCRSMLAAGLMAAAELNWRSIRASKEKLLVTGAAAMGCVVRGDGLNPMS